jgi:hypothetical protein
LVLHRNGNLGDCIPHDFWNKFDNFHRECFEPVVFINVLFFKKRALLLGNRNYGLMIDKLEWKVDVGTTLASIYHIFVQVLLILIFN